MFKDSKTRFLSLLCEHYQTWNLTDNFHKIQCQNPNIISNFFSEIQAKIKYSNVFKSKNFLNIILRIKSKIETHFHNNSRHSFGYLVENMEWLQWHIGCKVEIYIE